MTKRQSKFAVQPFMPVQNSAYRLRFLFVCRGHQRCLNPIGSGDRAKNSLQWQQKAILEFKKP